MGDHMFAFIFGGIIDGISFTYHCDDVIMYYNATMEKVIFASKR